MAAVVRIDGESRGAQEAIQKVSTDLRGMASTATTASTQASSALGGMAASFGRMTTAVFLGGSAVEVARKGLQFLTSSVAEYIATNEEAQRQTAALRGNFTEMRASLGAMVLELGEATGATDALAGAFQFLGDSFDAVAGRSASGIRAGVGADLEVLRSNAERVRREVETLSAEVEDFGRYRRVSSLDIEEATIGEALENRIALLRQYTEALDESSQAQAAAGASAVQYAFRLAQFGGPNAEEARPASRGRSGPRVDEMRAAKEEERALADKLTQRREAVLESFNETGRLERERVDAIQEQAEREIEIERGKQAAIMELRATVKAGDMAEQSEAAAAALELVRSRQEAVASSAAQAFAGLADANEKFSKSVVKSTANQLAVKGVEGIFEGAMMALRGNPLGVPLGLKGLGALLTARGLGSTISEGGGRGAGTPAAPITNNNVSVNVVVPNGMQSDQVTYVTRAAEEGARRGVRQDRR